MANINLPQHQHGAPQPAVCMHTVMTVVVTSMITMACAVYIAQNPIPVTYSGSQTQMPSTVYYDCKDALNQGQTRSGIYRIKPDRLPAFEVYCDMDTDGGGWVVFQRRMDGTVDFYRNWIDYVKGFGDLNGEFWLGLNKIHRLTHHKRNMLRVELEDFEGSERHAIYNSFQILDSSREYQIEVSGYKGFRGSAGDSLQHHSGMKFTTYDRDNDQREKHNCANVHKGAWWYTACHESNLNGRYLSGRHPNNTYADGINWKTWFSEGEKSNRYSLKITEMKIRPLY